MKKVSKHELNTIVSIYKNRFIDFEQQKEMPNHVVNDWVSWLFHQWNAGLINLHQYRKLLNIDILTA